VSKNKLGKGLNALLGDNLLGEEILQLDPSLITTSPFQPRSAVDDDDIDDLVVPQQSDQLSAKQE